jgi:hypothetical protein
MVRREMKIPRLVTLFDKHPALSWHGALVARRYRSFISGKSPSGFNSSGRGFHLTIGPFRNPVNFGGWTRSPRKTPAVRFDSGNGLPE